MREYQLIYDHQDEISKDLWPKSESTRKSGSTCEFALDGVFQSDSAMGSLYVDIYGEKQESADLWNSLGHGTDGSESEQVRLHRADYVRTCDERVIAMHRTSVRSALESERRSATDAAGGSLARACAPAKKETGADVQEMKPD